MKKTVYTWALLLLTINVLCQNTFEIKYQENSKISDKSGKPGGVETNYLPLILSQHIRHFMIFEGKLKWIDEKDLDIYRSEFGKEIIKDSLFYNGIMESDQKWFSRYLYEFKEPVLSNYYLGEEIIRLTYLRAFDKPIMIKLSRHDNSALLNIKILSNQIDVEIFRDLLQANYKTISDPKKLAELQENKSLRIDKPTLLHLDSLIKNTKIKSEIPADNTISGLDGCELLLEIHSSNGYYYIKRMNPGKDSSIWKIAECLIKASKTTEKID